MTTTSGREAILARIREALGPAGRPEVEIVRDYARRPAAAGEPATVARFVERLRGLHAGVAVVSPSGVAGAVGAALIRHRCRSVIVPPGLDESWVPPAGATPSGLRHLHDEPPLSREQLDRADAVLTTATVGVADSGTVILDHSAGQGRRILSLLPDVLVVVLPVTRIVAELPAALDRLDPARPLTFVTGPSATVDIELVRVEGVHGPRRIDVVLVAT